MGDSGVLDVQALLLNVGTTGVALAVIGFIVKALLGRALDNVGAASLARYQSGLERELHTHIERIKTDQRVWAYVQESRTARLDDKRLEVALGLNERMHYASAAFAEYMGPVQTLPIAEDEKKVELQRRRLNAVEKFNELMNYYFSKDVLLPKPVTDLLEGALVEMRKTLIAHDVWSPEVLSGARRELNEQRWKALQEIWHTVSTKLPEAKVRLRTEFQMLISPTPASSPKVENE